MPHSYVIIDDTQMRGYQILDGDGNVINESHVQKQYALPVEEVEAQAADTVAQFDEQEQMRLAAEVGLVSEKKDPKWELETSPEVIPKKAPVKKAAKKSV